MKKWALTRCAVMVAAALVGVSATGAARATTYYVNALEGATYTTTVIPVPGANTKLTISPLYTFSPGDIVDFGNAVFTPFLQGGLGSGSGASEVIGTYRAVFGPIGPLDISQFHLDFTGRGCLTVSVPSSNPSHCNNFVPSPSVTAALRFTLPSNTTQIQLALIGPDFSLAYTPPTMPVPGPVAGAGLTALVSLFGMLGWARSRRA